MIGGVVYMTAYNILLSLAFMYTQQYKDLLLFEYEICIEWKIRNQWRGD